VQENDPKRSRQTFDENFKKEAVSVFQSSKKSLKQVALELGVHENNLRNWIEKYAPKESENDGPSVQELQSEVRRLRKELAERAEEVTILKKATAFFATQTKP